MARISGVDIRGRSASRFPSLHLRIASRCPRRSARAPTSTQHEVRDLTDEEITRLRNDIDANLRVEGDLRRDISRNQAQDGDQLLSGRAAPQGPARPRSAHAHQRPHPQGPKKTVAGKKKVRK